MDKYKYPRTYHFPFSEGASSDDKILKDTNIFAGKRIVVTIKMDGENTTVYPDGTFHARSMDSKHRSYHSYLANIVNTFYYNIPTGYRVCGEYMYAKHSISYDNLDTYFYVFGIYDDKNTCLSWEDTTKLCKELGIITVPVVYEGIYDEEKIKQLAKETVANGQEGIVVRIADSFQYEDFSKNVAKFVRKGHVQTDEHWTDKEIIPNKLKQKSIDEER